MELIRDLARNLRIKPTGAEKRLWENIRNRKLGAKFNRQFPIRFEYENTMRFFIADFHCAELKLIVEIDGKIHDHQKEYDENRTHVLSVLGYKVVRYKNDEVMNNLKRVIEDLKNHLI